MQSLAVLYISIEGVSVYILCSIHYLAYRQMMTGVVVDVSTIALCYCIHGNKWQEINFTTLYDVIVYTSSLTLDAVAAADDDEDEDLSDLEGEGEADATSAKQLSKKHQVSCSHDMYGGCVGQRGGGSVVYVVCVECVV